MYFLYLNSRNTLIDMKIHCSCFALYAAASPQRACLFCNPAAEVGDYVAEAFSDGFEVGAGRITASLAADRLLHAFGVK